MLDKSWDIAVDMILRRHHDPARLHASAHIAGLSFGGTVAIDTALAHPAVVDGLIVVATAPLNGWEWVEGNPVAPALMLMRTEGVEAGKTAFLELPMLDAAREQPDVVSRLKQISDDSDAWHMHNQDPPHGQKTTRPTGWLRSTFPPWSCSEAAMRSMSE
ncbi:MAG: alpha/beta hydrolase [Acidimicrobiia bacterium]|nr:alpha/beta hydrolase [Acidimicrobiia bacterium]